jgi:hypothetical protein
MNELSTNSILQTSALLHATFHTNTATEDSSLPQRTRSRTDTPPSTDSDDDDTNDDNYEGMVVSPDTTRSTSSDDKEARKAGGGAAADFPSLIDHIVSSEHSVPVTSPLGEPREVHFDVPEFSLSHDCDFQFRYEKEAKDDLLNGDTSRLLQESRAEIEVLHQQLNTTLSDLSAEKAIRHRKEKSLVKLAKELNKRSAQADENERNIVRLASTINKLQAAASADSERYTDSLKERNGRIVDLEATVEQLHTRLYASQLAGEGLSVRLAEAKRSRDKSLELYGWVALVAIAWWFVLAVWSGRGGQQLWSLSMPWLNISTVRNAICAPAMPGTRLAPKPFNTISMEAPWWVAPSRAKGTVYQLLCSKGTAPVKLSWKRDRLVVFQSLNDRHDKILFQGTASAGVKIGANEIIMTTQKKHGTVAKKVVAAPWAMAQW